MNTAKIQFSPGHYDAEGADGAGIYHKISREGEIGGKQRTEDSFFIEAEELALVKDAAWILTKNRILRKVIGLFSGLAGEMTAIWENVPWPARTIEWLPPVTQAGPKISKGENYQGLPWVVLDHPRLFTREDVFAIRTLFWWGHYFSMTLHLKGTYKARWMTVIKDNISVLATSGFYICVSADEWRHELTSDNYLSLNETDFPVISDIIEKADFLKFSAEVKFQHWNEAQVLLLQLFRSLLRVLASENER